MNDTETTKQAVPAPPRITSEYAGRTYEVRLRGDDLDPQRIECAREIAAACWGLFLRAGRRGPNMTAMVEHELRAAVKRLDDLG